MYKTENLSKKYIFKIITHLGKITIEKMKLLKEIISMSLKFENEASKYL